MKQRSGMTDANWKRYSKKGHIGGGENKTDFLEGNTNNRPQNGTKRTLSIIVCGEGERRDHLGTWRGCTPNVVNSLRTKREGRSKGWRETPKKTRKWASNPCTRMGGWNQGKRIVAQDLQLTRKRTPPSPKTPRHKHGDIGGQPAQRTFTWGKNMRVRTGGCRRKTTTF